MEPGLEETTFYDPENFVFPFGAHACIVDVDAETGKIDIVRYVAVDDCGPAINPKLIDGQIHGGITHAIGQALYERIHYDEDGQLVTGTFVDYALPSAADVPSFETDRTETPSPVNSLGVKGVGEAGTIAASPAIVNAVIDALRPLGVDYINMPLSPQRVWAAIQRPGRDVPRTRASRAARGTSTGAAAPAPDRPRRAREVGVIPAEFDYVAPESLDEALAALRDGGEDAKLLAGGHSLLPLMKLRLAAPTLLVDLRRVPGLAGHPARERRPCRIGAMTTHTAMSRTREPRPRSPRSRARSPTRRSATAGTLGGSLAHGDPASDQPAILLASEGSVTVRGAGGEREIAAADLFEDYLTTAVGDDEVLTEVSYPALDGYGFGYQKFNRRQEDWAMVAVSALVKKAGDGSCEDVRDRAHAHGQRAAAGDRRRGGAARAGRSTPPRSPRPPSRPPRAPTRPADLNASPDYKRHLARVLCRRALEEAAA